jgi:hypothetical protein
VIQCMKHPHTSKARAVACHRKAMRRFTDRVGPQRPRRLPRYREVRAWSWRPVLESMVEPCVTSGAAVFVFWGAL